MKPPAQQPLEDDFRDVIRKAASGQGIADADIGRAAGLSGLLYAKLFSAPVVDAGKHPELIPAILRIAGLLGIGGPQLTALARGESRPPEHLDMEGVFVATTPFGGVTVNAALVWDPATRAAAAFDSGGDADPLLEKAASLGLDVQTVFVTHTHGDHVFDIDRLAARARATIWAPENEPWAGARLFAPRQTFQIGSLGVEARPTPGHSPGGITYVISGLERPVAVVGDALFCCSAGGAKVSYTRLLKGIREEILTLPPGALLIPGHGPLTTVGFEIEHNPFCGGCLRHEPASPNL